MMTLEIKMIENGIPGAAIAREEGVDRTAIYHMIAGRSKFKRLRRTIERAPGEKFWSNNIREKAAQIMKGKDMYRVIFTDRKGVSWAFSNITRDDVADLFLKTSMVEPFTVPQMQDEVAA